MNEIQEALKGTIYPAAKGDLVEYAKMNTATKEVLDLIDELPDVDFEGPDEVQEALGKNPPENKKENTETDKINRKEMEERKNELKETTGKLTEPGKNVTGELDHRLKGQETEALAAARHMEHGYDGRGRITNPAHDARLAENRAKPENRDTEKPKRMTWKELQHNK